jgi:hypothetical protein
MASNRQRVQKSARYSSAPHKNKKAARHTPNRLVQIRSLVRGCVSRLSLLCGVDADVPTVPPLILELHDPGDQREQRVVLALTDVNAGLMLRAALPNQDRSGVHELTAKSLYAKPLSV